MTVGKAVWNQIQSNDYRLMRRVHRWRAPRWFRILMILMTRMGDGWLWYSVGLILLTTSQATTIIQSGVIWLNVALPQYGSYGTVIPPRLP